MSRTLLRVSSGWPRLASMLITLLGAAVAAAACSPTPAPTAAVAPKAQAIVDGVTFRLGWLYSGYDIPFFVAIDKGYYREQGLDVTINQGQGSGLTMQSVGGGQDTFGFVDASVAAVGIQKGVPIKMVAIYQQINPQALLVLEDSGIKTVNELDGKSVAVIPGANTTLFLPQFLQASGVDPAKVQLINTDPANLIPSFLARKVDVTTALINFQPIQLEAQGHKVRSFLFADAGIAALSGGIAVHTNTIQEKPDMIRRFLTATLQGWNFALGDSATSVDSMMKLVPGQDRNILLGQFSATVPLLQTSNSKGKPLGWMAQADWAETVDSLLRVGSLQDRMALEPLYTNEFLPQ